MQESKTIIDPKKISTDRLTKPGFERLYLSLLSGILDPQLEKTSPDTKNTLKLQAEEQIVDEPQPKLNPILD